MPIVQFIMSNDPPMTGAASGPVDATPQGIVKYVLTQQDQDTYYDGPNLSSKQQADPTCRIAAVRINSMSQYQYIAREFTADGKVTWDVTGYAVVQPGIYVDVWRLVNARLNVDPGFDPPVLVGQTVMVKATPAPGGPTLASATTGGEHAAVGRILESTAVNRFLIEAADHALFHPFAEHHSFGAGLRNELAGWLSPEDSEELQARGQVQLPMSAVQTMSGNLADRVRRYARDEQDRLQRAGAIFPPLDLSNERELRIIVRSTTNSVPSVGGMTDDGQYLQF